MVAFAKTRRVSHVMGAHIEMTREPGKDYPQAAKAHSDEHPLELPYADLLELQAAIHGMGDSARREVHPDFIVFPLPPPPENLRFDRSFAAVLHGAKSFGRSP